MKRFVLIFLIFNISIFASLVETQKDIYKTILYAIFPQKNTIKIWVDDKKLANLLNHMKRVKIIDEYNKADILILKNRDDIDPKDKRIFVDGYRMFKKYKNVALGGFYWQKGRPNVILLKKNLNRFAITLPKSFETFIEDEEF